MRAFGLAAAVAVPILYYGTQVAALPFHPGYDWLRQPASTLGSDQSLRPWLFNGGAMLTGLASFAAAYGIAAACIVLTGCCASGQREREHRCRQQWQGTTEEEVGVSWHGSFLRCAVDEVRADVQGGDGSEGPPPSIGKEAENGGPV